MTKVKRYASEDALIADMFRSSDMQPVTREELEETVTAPQEKSVGLYHVMRAHETFEETAHAIFEIVKIAEERAPGRKRVLFLDIDEHRNQAGGFDDDAYEIQKSFVLGFIARFLTGGQMPLIGFRNKNQSDDVPPALEITNE